MYFCVLCCRIRSDIEIPEDLVKVPCPVMLVLACSGRLRSRCEVCIKRSRVETAVHRIDSPSTPMARRGDG